jgi:Protein of unknown function (DUF2934)
MRSPPNFDPLRFVQHIGLSPEVRRQLIAEAAYLRSQSRGANPGSPTEDWLAAEKEVDSRFLFRHTRTG